MKAWWLIAFVAACGKDAAPPPTAKSPDEVKSEWGPKVAAKLAKLVAAAKATETAELGTTDAKLALDFYFIDETKHPNALVVLADDVQSATAPRPTPPAAPKSNELWRTAAEGQPIEIPVEQHHPFRFGFISDSNNHVFIAKQLLGIEQTAVAPAYWYEQLVNAKYALVVTPSDVQWPNGYDGSKFQQGTVRLRAVLVDIDTATPLGGFETTVTSSDKVRVEKDQRPDERSRLLAEKRLDNDLLSQAGQAIRKGITQQWPAANTPLDWGY